MCVFYEVYVKCTSQREFVTVPYRDGIDLYVGVEFSHQGEVVRMYHTFPLNIYSMVALSSPFH